MFRRLIVAALVCTALLLGLSETAIAAKRPAPAATPSSIRLNEADPHLGGTVTFTVTVDRSVKNPRIDIYCYKDGVLGWATAGAYTESFKLGGDWSAWKDAGGAANCIANLYWWTDSPSQPQTYNLLATTSFNAAG